MITEDMTQAIIAGAEKLMEHVDHPLMAKLGDILAEYASEQETWRLEKMIATMVDTLAYMVAEYGPDEGRRTLLAITAAALSTTGVGFIHVKEHQDAKGTIN